jgi:hypothetical protein
MAKTTVMTAKLKPSSTRRMVRRGSLPNGLLLTQLRLSLYCCQLLQREHTRGSGDSVSLAEIRARRWLLADITR